MRQKDFSLGERTVLIPVELVTALKYILLLQLVFLFGSTFNHWSGRLESGAWVLIVGAITAFLAMNFTGASTYTSLSGVKKEMKTAVPVQIGAAALGLILWISSRIAAGMGGSIS